MKRVVGYFLNGLIFTAPAALTIYVIWFVFTTVDGWLRIPIPGVGFVVTIVLITLVGFLASNFLARRLLDWIDELLEHLPGVRLLYTGIKDVTGAFVGEKKRFRQPVVVTLDPVVGSKAIGFLTQDSLDELGMADYVTVYLPFSYSFAGHTLLFPRDRVTPLDAPSAKVMTFVVSGGVAEVR
ncbi:MAG TPA: DUF502 domain-containing protein [Gemmatimonadales bacterium]|nr:DUF502 domain-containing protein [Gemmatimonadales bacterium]